LEGEMNKIHPSARIHPTAIIEEGVSIGAGTAVWDNVHIRRNSMIGETCIIGEKTYIAYDVIIGHGVKISSFVYICTGVTIEDQVMIAAGAVFTNDRFPRAFDPDAHSPKTSAPTEETMKTLVRHAATIGAGSVIGPGIELQENCMIGMGSVVTRNVLPHQLVYGNPARPHGYVCLCGIPLEKSRSEAVSFAQAHFCPKCRRKYSITDSGCRLR
jgi:acetyltransferase-like isoleucine patch superfamily enzyme